MAVGSAHASSVIEYEEVQGYAAQHVKQDDSDGEQIHCESAFFEALEEAWAYLQTYAVDEEYESEVLYEAECGSGASETKVASYDAGKQDECYAQGNSKNLQSAQRQANADDTGIEHYDVCDAVG